MKYELQYNPARKVWVVWRIAGSTAEIIKAFKTETAAKKYIGRMNK